MKWLGLVMALAGGIAAWLFYQEANLTYAGIAAVFFIVGTFALFRRED